MMVGGVFGETTPTIPLYVVEALLVEGAALVLSTRRPLAFGATAGALIGLALRVTHQTLPHRTRVVLPAAALVVVYLLAYGLSTSAPTGASARVALTDVPGQGGRQVAATVTIDPPAAASETRWLTITAWQGGGRVVDRLKPVSPGIYRPTQPIPVHDDWKAMIRLHSGRSLLAVPVYLPEDPAIPAKAVPAQPQFTREFVRDKEVLQREAKPGALGLTILAYGLVLAIAVALLGLIAWSLARLAGNRAEPPAAQRAQRRRAAPTTPLPSS